MTIDVKVEKGKDRGFSCVFFVNYHTLFIILWNIKGDGTKVDYWLIKDKYADINQHMIAEN